MKVVRWEFCDTWWKLESVDLGSETIAMEFLKLQLECYLKSDFRGKMENLKKKHKKIQNQLVLKKLFSEK